MIVITVSHFYCFTIIKALQQMLYKYFKMHIYDFFIYIRLCMQTIPLG